MTNIAVISKQKRFFDVLTTHFNRLPLHFYWFADVPSFLNQSAIEDWQLLLLIERDPDRLQEFLVTLNENNVELPYVCITRQPQTEERELLWQLGVREIIPWPAHRQEMEFMFRAYHEFLSARLSQDDEYLYQGSLECLPGQALLRALSAKHSSGILHLQWGERKGRVEFKDGQMIHASYKQLDPLTSLLVLASWTRGFAFFKAEPFVSKRSIILSNEQIFVECQQYLKDREEMIRKFPSQDTPLYPHPDLNFEDFGPNERTWLYKMYQGKSVHELWELYDGDFNFLLKKLVHWFEKQYIVTEEVYHKLKTQKAERASTPAFKRLMRKLFSREEKQTPEEAAQTEEKKEFLPGEASFEHRFNGVDLLQQVKSRLEESA